jgi:hypothetical protein
MRVYRVAANGCMLAAVSEVNECEFPFRGVNF